MGRSTRRKEKHKKSGELQGTSARTRPLSYDEIMLKRNNKKLNEDVESLEERNIEVGKVGRISIIQNDFNVDKYEGHRHGKDFSPGDKKCLQEGTEKRGSHKKDGNASWRKDDMSIGKHIENLDSRKRLKSEVRKDTNFVDESNYEKQIHVKKTNERPAGPSEKIDAKKHSNLIEKDRHAGRSEGKNGRDIKRKHQTSYDEKNGERNTKKIYDIQKGHASETVERKEKKEGSRSHYEESHHKTRRSRSREREERHRRSSSLPHKRASHHFSEHKQFSHDVRDKSTRQHSDERSKMTSNGSSGHRRRKGGSTSGLGGYSPRKRKTEVAVKTPSPARRSTEKRTAKWDLAPAGAEKVVSASLPSNLLASNHTASLNMHAVVSSVPSISISASRSSFLSRNSVSLDAVQLTEGTRPMRRLYVENVPDIASEKAIMEYFNNFLLSSAVNHIRVTRPCISCIIHKGRGQALVEFLTPEDASAALSLDGSPFSGSILKIRRPKDFVEVTGEPEKLEATVSTPANDTVKDSHHKIFVGGIPKALSSEMFVEIAKAFGPLKTYHFEISKDLNEQYAILEYLDQSVTLKACAGLNGMKLGGKVITAVQADPDAASLGNAGDHQCSIIPQLARPLLQKPTLVLKLKNLFPEDFASVSEAQVEEVLEDVRLECSRFGTIKSLHVVKHENTTMTAGDNEMHDDPKENGGRIESDKIKFETEIMEIANDGNSRETAGSKLPSDTQEVAAGNRINNEEPVDESCQSNKFENNINSKDINHESLDREPFQPKGLDNDDALGAHVGTGMAVEDLASETVLTPVSVEVSNSMNTLKEKSADHSDKNPNNIQSECVKVDKILATEEKSNVEDINGKLPEGHPNTKGSVDDPASKSVSIAISEEIPQLLNTQKEEPDSEYDKVSNKVRSEVINAEEKSVRKEDLEVEESDGSLPEATNDSATGLSKKSDTIEKNKNEEEINLQHIFEPGCVFIEYRRTEASCMAAHCIHGRTFDGRTVTVEYIDPDLYRVKFPN